MDTTKKCIALIRVSSRYQDLDQQTEAVKEQIRRDGYGEGNIITIEDKESGSKLSEEERNGLNKLKEHILTDPDIDAVYCYEISRISRRTEVVYSIRDFLISRKINLICCNPYFRLLNDNGSISETSHMVFGVFSGLAEQETYLRKSRIMRGKEKKKSEGKLSCGKAVFGYTVDKQHYVLEDPVNGPLVREIFDRFVNRLESSGTIAKDFFFRGTFKSKTSKIVNYQTYICQILKDRRYMIGNDDPVYPGFIDKPTFEKAQEIRGNRAAEFRKKTRTIACYPLQGYIKTVDGYTLVPSVTNNRYLKSSGYSVVGHIGVNMKGMHTLTGIALKDYLESGVSSAEIERTRTELNKELSLNEVKISSINEKIDAIREENKRIESRIIKGRIGEEEGDRMIDDNLDMMKKLEDEIQDITYRNGIILNRLAVLADPVLLAGVGAELDTDEDLKKAVIKYLDKVILTKEERASYKLEYIFLDGLRRIYYMTANTNGCRYYNDKKEELI